MLLLEVFRELGAEQGVCKVLLRIKLFQGALACHVCILRRWTTFLSLVEGMVTWMTLPSASWTTVMPWKNFLGRPLSPECSTYSLANAVKIRTSWMKHHKENLEGYGTKATEKTSTLPHGQVPCGVRVLKYFPIVLLLARHQVQALQPGYLPTTSVSLIKALSPGSPLAIKKQSLPELGSLGRAPVTAVSMITLDGESSLRNELSPCNHDE